jgi:hypothetical protein
MEQAFIDLNLSSDLQRMVKHLSNRIGDDPQHRLLIDELKSAIIERDQNRVGLLLNQGLTEFGVLHPLVAIAQVWETIGSVFRTLGLDDETRLATLNDINLWIVHHAESNNGERGLSRVFWVNRLLTARIVQFGRLQFEERIFPYPAVVYQNSGFEFLALSDGGLTLDRDGYPTKDENRIIRTTMGRESIDLVSGAIGKERIDDSLLTKVLDEQSRVLFVHIPALGPLCPHLVEESLRKSEAFFGKGWAYICTSWLLDPALEDVVDSASNIRSFNRRFSKLPVFFEAPQLFERVFFCNDEASVLSADATTSLQKNVQKALQNGVVFRTMGGFFLR